MGKSTPSSKRQCNCREATRCCDIPISQIGKRFHFIPKAFVDMVFFSPAIPAWVLCHIKAHPPTWMWTLRAGPRAGTTLTVPIVPIHCASDAHRAVQWLVSIFHIFKGSLQAESSIAITDERVISPLVRIYQNNMLLHIDAQMHLYDCLYPLKDLQEESTLPQPQPQPCVRPPQTRTTNTPAPQPPPSKHALCSAKIVALHAELDVLHKKLDASLEHPSPPSPYTILAMAPSPSHPSHPSPSTSASVQSCTDHPDHQ